MFLIIMEQRLCIINTHIDQQLMQRSGIYGALAYLMSSVYNYRPAIDAA